MADVNRSVTVTLTADDYAVANKLFMLDAFRQPSAIALPLLLAVVYAALRLAPAVGDALGEIGSMLEDIVPAVLAVIIGFRLLNYFLLAPRTARATYQKQKTLHYPCTFSWSESGLKTTSTRGEWNTPWSDFFKLVENSQTILLYQSPKLFQMLPKRALEQGQIADILQCAASLRR